MSMAPTTEPHSPTSDLGQRFFVLGIFAVLVAEVAVVVTNAGHWFEWSSCILGIISALGILYLGNWLYTGDRTALKVMRVWVVLQLLLVVAAFIFKLSETPGEATWSAHLGINALWQGYLKLAAYLGLAGLLFVPGVTLDFFSTQRGEAPAPPAKTIGHESIATGGSVELTTEQTKALDGLGGAMKAVSGVLVVVGGFQILSGILAISDKPRPGFLLSVVEGTALAALGLVLLLANQAIQLLLGASPRTMGHVMHLFDRLMRTYGVYFVMLLILVAVAVCRLVFNVL